jgi:hypothetical protein
VLAVVAASLLIPACSDEVNPESLRGCLVDAGFDARQGRDLSEGPRATLIELHRDQILVGAVYLYDTPEQASRDHREIYPFYFAERGQLFQRGSILIGDLDPAGSNAAVVETCL